MGRRRNGRSTKKPVTALEALRRKRDWSYQELGDDIERTTGHRRNQDCWRKICLGITQDPQSRTLSILEDYLSLYEPVAS